MATTSDTDPLATVYRQAFQCYQKLYDDGKLKEKQFALIKGRNTIEEVLNAVRNAEIKNKSERNAVQRVLRRASESLVGKLCRFEGVVSTTIQANPNISALVWGGVKFVLVIARDIFDSYEMACELVLKITFALERFHDYAEIFRDRVTNLLERRLVLFYESILGFCIKATTFYLQGTIGKFLSSIRKHVSEEFSKLSSKLDTYAEEIHKAAETENMRNTRQVPDLLTVAAPPLSRVPSASSINASALCHWMVPYSRNRLFTGRKSAVEEIEGLASDVGHRRIALYGLGGVGKTQIALECAYRRRGKCHVFWVHASGHAKFSQDYKKISEHVGLQSSDKEEEILAKVKDWFQSAASGEWLLLLDNADDLSDFAGNDSSLSRYIPRGSKGAVIITTRSRQVASRLNCEAIEIKAMDVEEAAQLFSQRCPQYKSAQDAEAVSKLLESLDYCPLAVVGATSFMIQMNTSPSEYLELLNSTQQARQELPLTQFNDAHREVLEICGSDMTERVLSTYYTTFKQIEKQLPLAADFLRLIAFLDRQGIQQELLAASKLDDVDNKVLFRMAIRKLVDFSLVTWAEGGTMLALHRLVHLSIKTYLSQQETKEWRTKALELVSRVFPQRAEHENRHTCATYLPHALVVTHNSQGPITSSLLYRMACHLRQKGDSRNAEIHCRRSFALREAVGKDDLDTLESVSELASVLQSQGKYEEAEQMNRRVLEGREKALGRDHPDTLNSVNNLASVLQNQGKYKQAEQMNRRALEGRKKVLGPDHHDTLNSVNNLASVLRNQGMYEQAEQMNRWALEAKLKVLGPDHPDTLESVSELASVLQSQGKYEQAEQMNRRALEGREKALGPDHPDTLNSVNNWASVLQNQGKYEQAEQMNRRALEAKEKVLGPDHPDTLTSMANLASTYRNQGRSKEAEVLGVQVMETRKRVLGQDHPSTLTSMANLASTYRNQGRSKEAEVLEVQVAVNGRKERIVRLLLDSGVDSTKLKDKEQILASILHETNSDVESDSDAESLLSCGSIFSDQSSLSSQSSISPNIPSEARAQAEDIVACTLGINDEISQVVSKAGQKWSEDKIDRQMSRAIKEFSGHLASHAVEGSPVLERIPVLLRLRALPIARKIRALSDYNFEPVVVSPVNERALYKYLQENTDTREIFQPENILRFLDDDVRSTYVDERDLQTGLETEEVLSDTSNQSDGEEDFELQQSSEVDQGQQSVEQSREFLSRKDIADLFLQAVQRNFLKQKKPKENFKPEIPHGENDNLLEASGQDCPSADNAEETSLVSIPHPCASPPGDLNSSRREWEEEGIPKYTKSESEQISNSDISETARFEKDYQSNTCEINRTQVVGVVNQHNTEEDSPCSQRTSDLFLNDQEVVHAVFIKASFALLLSAFSLVVLGSKVPVSSKAIFYTALAGHALEWKLIMAVIHVSFGDIMVDILDTLSKLLPKSMMWFGRRFRCLHDHCTSENHGRKLSFHNFCELAAHFQQHHMQHSGPYSTNSGSQPILPSDPEQAAPDITITVVPGISQQDRDQSQSTTHQPCRTNDSVPDETHVLDICVPVTDSSSSDIHLLDELQFSTEWKDPVLLGQLKIKFHKKQSYARFLPWRLLHLKRLQRVNIKKYNFHRAINPDTVICLRDPVTAGCEPFHGLDNLLLTEYQEMLAMYVENPACCSKDQEFWVAELGNVKRDRNAQKSERTWYGIRFEEQWSRSCFISLLVLISTFGVAISVVLIRKRSWEAGLGFTGAYFALVAFLFSTLVFMNSRGR